MKHKRLFSIILVLTLILTCLSLPEIISYAEGSMMPYEITELNANTVTVKKIAENSDNPKVVVALYHDGQTADVQIEEIPAGMAVGESRSFKINFASTQNMAGMSLRAFIWTDINTAMPIAEAALTDSPSFSFNFSSQEKEGYTQVRTADEFAAESGYGFVGTSLPYTRTVDLSSIKFKDDGAYSDYWYSSGNVYSGGMIFRVALTPGTYDVEVVTATEPGKTGVSVSGMLNDKITDTKAWDDAGTVAHVNSAKWNDNTWSYRYVNGLDYMDIEIEQPYGTSSGYEVGVKEIKITPVVQPTQKADKPTIYILGDSTVKSYTFKEPLSGWGQTIQRFFDLDKVNIVNYSMGGRSTRTAYNEGRLNDLLLNAKPGDYLLVQFGHNDSSATYDYRRERYVSETDYKWFLTNVYAKAAEQKGVKIVFVTPMTRQSGKCNSPTEKAYSGYMKTVANAGGHPFYDLNAKSVSYFSSIGSSKGDAYTDNMFAKLEAGESPQAVSNRSVANFGGDGTHFREAAAKQWARLIVEEIIDKSSKDEVSAQLKSYLKGSAATAQSSSAWDYTEIITEFAPDIEKVSGTTKQDGYYRDAMEKMIRLGAMSVDEKGNFNPSEIYTVGGFIESIAKLARIDKNTITGYVSEDKLTRNVMAEICYDAYILKFGSEEFKTDFATKYENASKKQFFLPLVEIDSLSDSSGMSEKAKKAYAMGLVRSDQSSLKRYKELSGSNSDKVTKFEPESEVSRAKAAKHLSFMWILFNNANIACENQLTIEELAAMGK